MSGSFYVFYGENVISLFLRVARHIVERFAFREKHFQDIARLKFG